LRNEKVASGTENKTLTTG